MNTTMLGAVAASLSLCASGVLAQESSIFTWEGEIEIGSDSVIDSNTAGNEVTDNYLITEINMAAQFTPTFSAFLGLTLESGLDPAYNGDGTFEGVGLYSHEFGVQFDIASTSIMLGKVHPSFGTTWDSAAGFYGATLAEDYELAEQIGILADVSLGDGSTLSFGLFYADDTALSRSAFTDRGRNTTAAGGAGNTGQLNNASIQWTKEFGDTAVLVGARYLTAGTGDVDDETGFVAAVAHSLGGVDLFGEVAAFQNYGGGTDDATYLTLNAAYGIASNTTLSGTYARRDLDTAGVTDMVSLAVEYELQNGVTLGGAIGYSDDNGTNDTLWGLNILIPLGG
ncbi:hypothetical protein [Shimia thalassica]|uniref:hypothetical protein n=1 Tax=Shimia thalassica TaxID=1715693 RepID=UPI0026E38DCC|nr:hypothetical protein [Shimia thalassica]MDO6799989.1 hypothetical protein [Shimia thalassica]